MKAAAAQQKVKFGPQPGFQWSFLASEADITIGGGAAGCGKTYAEILAPLRNINVDGFTSVFFRRTNVQVKNPGGLWDESWKVYPLTGAVPNNGDLTWTWPSGAYIKMAHLDREVDVYEWQGSQVALIIWDELTHFTSKQFWYMLSRNRTTCGVKPRILASCNPDADSWVAELIAWWIDQDEFLPSGEKNPTFGLPIESRTGKLRYFARLNETMVWGDTKEEVLEADIAVVAAVEETMQKTGATYTEAVDVVIKSITFIPGKLEENKILEREDPKYRGNLMALDRVQRERLLGGNWKIRATAGMYFRRHEVTMLDEEPTDLVAVFRAWDLAATEHVVEGPGKNDPDWTAGVKMGKRRNGRFVVLDAILVRKRSDDVRTLVRRTAATDGRGVKIFIPQDPGQAGKDQAKTYIRLLAGFSASSEGETGDKETRAEPFASQWQHGNVDVVRGHWNAEYFSQLEAFPTPKVHDDAVDASSSAFRKLNTATSMFAVQ